MSKLNKLINRLHPRSPSTYVDNLQSYIDSKNSATRDNYRLVENSAQKILNRKEIGLLTDEDYILSIDKVNHSKIEFKPVLLYCLYGARIFGPDGDIVNSKNMVLAELTPQNGIASEHSLFRKRRFNKPSYLQGTTLNLLTPHSKNYYHWVFDALPILRSIDVNLINQILIPQASRFHLETLSKLGVSPDIVVEVKPDDVYMCETLLTSSYQWTMSPPPLAVKWVSENLATNRPYGNELVKNKIYISRGDSGWRNISNEIEVVQLLSEYGFKKVTLSNLSFDDQVSLFSNASHIVSAHGAGLTNLVFSDESTHLLEIFPPRWTSLCYAHLAQIVGCRYTSMIAQPLGITPRELSIDKAYIPREDSAQGNSMAIPMCKLKRYCQLFHGDNENESTQA